MNHTLNRAILTVSVLGMIVSVPVVAAFMAGLDGPGQTEVTVYGGGIESEGDDRRLTGIVYVFAADDDAVVHGLQVEVIGQAGGTLGFQRYGDVEGTSKLDVDVALPDAEVVGVRVRIDDATGASDLVVNGLGVDDAGALVAYEQSRSEYQY